MLVALHLEQQQRTSIKNQYRETPLQTASGSLCRKQLHLNINQSVENAGVAFVKGADERNKFVEKISNQ